MRNYIKDLVNKKYNEFMEITEAKRYHNFHL